MVRADVVSRKVVRATGWLDDAEALLNRPREEFLANVRDRDLASFYIFLAIQECIDLAAHWVADAGWPAPNDTASTFDVLADRGAIDRSLGNAMQAATGLRNRIGHGYAGVDHARLHEEATQGIAALRQFLHAASRAAGLVP
jgi:uncharacterized protein YutE (UPF0331/DUF86 family)